MLGLALSLLTFNIADGGGDSSTREESRPIPIRKEIAETSYVDP
jgi:hypothetical protein